MISKNHRQNHNFQLLYFLAGSCHTPDAAYALLSDQKDDRVSAINSYNVSKIKEKAKIIRAGKLLQSQDIADQLDAEAELLEISNNAASSLVLFEAAKDELAYINELMSKIHPKRKYKQLTDAEACQAMQQEEWKLELIHRAENSLLTTGTISPDHFATMRMHPEFDSNILPAIKEIQNAMKENKALAYNNNPVIKLLEETT